MTTPDDLSDLVRSIQDEQEREQQEHEQAPAQPVPAPRAVPRRPRASEEQQERRSRGRRRLLIACAIGAGAVLLGGGAAWAGIAMFSGDAEEVAASPATPKPTRTPEPVETEPVETPPAEPAPEPAAPQWSIDDPNSMQVVVNKQRPLNPIDWAPGDLVMPNVPSSNGQPLRAEAAAALEAMHAEATAAGVPFTLVSAYRDYNLQTSLFNNYAASDGVEAAETYSARPGHSEHQTGLAADISECMGCGLSEAFGETPQGQWARANAHRFGFILRYDQGQQPVVGYVYEPWHFRYVGTEIAGDMQAKGIMNLEEYLGLPAAPTY